MPGIQFLDLSQLSGLELTARKRKDPETPQWVHMVRACELSCLSHVRLLTFWTVAHQAPLSMGFSRQECWSGLQWVAMTSSRGSSQPRD